jgi:hypothetical protein
MASESIRPIPGIELKEPRSLSSSSHAQLRDLSCARPDCVCAASRAEAGAFFTDELADADRAVNPRGCEARRSVDFDRRNRHQKPAGRNLPGRPTKALSGRGDCTTPVAGRSHFRLRGKRPATAQAARAAPVGYG